MSTVTLAGNAASRARVQVPAWGAWWADVDLVDDAELSGAVELIVGDATMQGTIVIGGAANGRASYRLVGGANGWGQTIAAKGYADDAGVKVATVLQDAANKAEETIAGLPATRLGPHYARTAGPASRVLADLAPQNWYVDFDGVTQVGQRAATTYDGDGVRQRIDPAGSITEIATEDVAALVPGVQIDGSDPATDVEYVLDGTSLIARVYAGASTSRRIRALVALLEAADPRRRYRGLAEYRVVTQSASDRFALQPVRTVAGLPVLENVPTRGPAGLRSTVTLGELVLVAFADADPSRPCIVAHEAPDAPGWAASLVELGDTGGDYAALAGKVDSALADVFDWFDGWVTAPNDGGAALKLLFTTWKSTNPTGFDSVAASAVKVK